MQFTITRPLKGHQFAATLTGTADEAKVSFYRDGTKLGNGRWDGEGFVPSDLNLVPSNDTDDSEDVYSALAMAVRKHLRDVT